MQIPSFLTQQIRDGKAVVFLGAGASMGAKDASGKTPPSGKKLGEMLADRFLGGRLRENALSQIAELAINESNLVTVQEFIKDILEPFHPSEAHLLLAKFKWAGIATTNYDLLIENAYRATTNPLQTPKPFIENGDRVEDSMRDLKGVMLLKLHGCVTRLSNPHCPLILTADQYISHRKGRDRIFAHLTNSWAYERPIVFIGHSLQDPDIRAILLELAALSDTRPRYYLVVPKLEDIEVRLWESKRITPIKGSFEEFMRAIDAEVATPWQSLPDVVVDVIHPISQKFISNSITLSANCRQFLEVDVDYVGAVKGINKLDSKDFYKGHNKDWAAIEQNLDVRRVLCDQILVDNILKEEATKPESLEFILIKAHAGAGKTVLLRRLAWEAAHSYNALCLYLNTSGAINTAALQELVNACGERIYLFVDDVADRNRELQSLIKNIDTFGKQLTVIAAERVNEWNVSGTALAPHVTEEYDLQYLTNHEIDKLLELLDKHRALGELEGKSIQEQRVAFQEKAGRLLLVALHEATFGKPFEEIIQDEFENIVPIEARQIYLTVCVLNRLGVPVRAGIIARLHGIRFEEFERRFFKPLENVVSTEYDSVVRDFMYSTRHQVIAEIVFDRVLRNQEDKYENYIKCLQALNIDYACDRKAFRLMLRGRTLLDLFSNSEMIESVYKIAEGMVGPDPYVLHQKGLYKMHTNNLSAASELLARAEMLVPQDTTIKHTRSELLLKCAAQARTPLEWDKLLREASAIATSIRSARGVSDSYAYHTLVKIDLERLKELLSRSASDSLREEVESKVKNIERNLSEGLQRFPGDSYLLTAEAGFANIIEDSERVVECLQKAFVANPRTSFLAIRLSAHYSSKGKVNEATKVLEAALNANRTDKGLHYHFAKHLILHFATNPDPIIYHLQRSFSPGDANYDAQLLYGRQLYVKGDREESRQVFSRLRDVKVAPEFKRKMLYPLDGLFHGRVMRIEGNYAFLSRDGVSESVHLHRDNIDQSVWKLITQNSRCTYRIAFNFYGPGAIETVYAS